MNESKKRLRERWLTLLLTGLGLCVLLTRVHPIGALVFFGAWLLSGWLFPPLTNAVIKGLTVLRVTIGRSVMSILLALVYIFVLLPGALFQRLKNPAPAQSTWVEPEKTANWGDPF